MGVPEEEAWVTLATNDTYALGALVLAHSIRGVGTSRRLAALVTPGVTMAMRDQLSATFDLVQMVNVLDSGDSANLALLSRPDLGVTFTKLHCWRLTQYSKCVFLDADTLMLHPCDELFDREELSAAPDAGWPDCFNSGVFVFKPSMETYEKLLNFAVSHGSFDGGDQGLLNSFFSDWATKDISRHLPFIYNMCSTATYSYLPAYKKFGETVHIAHFIGHSKPWLQPFDSETRKVRVSADQEHQRMLLQIWWDIFCYHVHPHLSIDMRHRTSLVPQLENSTPAHFVHNLFENFHPKLFEPHLSHFDEEEWWVQSNEPSSNPTIEQIACLPNLPRDDPPENLQCNDQPGEVATDPSGEHSEPPPCMEVSLEPQIPYTPPAQPPSPQQSSVCLRSPLVTVGMVEEEAEREVSMHSVEIAGMPKCADPSPDDEGGLASAFSQMVLGAPKSEEQKSLEEHLRRQAWEVGQIDYLGQDSFDNVWKRIMHTLTLGPSSPQSPPSEPSQPSPVTLQTQPVSVPTPSAPSQPAPSQPIPAPTPQVSEPLQSTPPIPIPVPLRVSAPPQPSPSPPKATPPAPRPTPTPPKATPPPPKATPPPPKATPPPPKATPPAPKAIPPPPIAPPSPGAAPQKSAPLSPESTSPVQPTAPPPTPVKPTVPSSPTPPAAAKVTSTAAAPVAAAPVAAAPVPAATAPPPSGAAAAPKQAPPKSAPAAAPEEAAKGPAPVAPKRKSAGAAQQQQQQGGSGRGKSGGPKGKK